MKYRTKLKILMCLSPIWAGSSICLFINCVLSNQYLGELLCLVSYFLSLCTFYSMQAKIEADKERNSND